MTSGASHLSIRLHQAIDLVVFGQEHDIAQNRLEALALIRKGADVNAIFDSITPLTRLLQGDGQDIQVEAVARGMSLQTAQVIEDNRVQARIEIMKALLGEGANPFLGRPNAFRVSRMGIPGDFLKALADLEHEGEYTWRGIRGETPLHAVIDRSEINLFVGGIEAFCHADGSRTWARETDHEGRTAGHWLWRAMSDRPERTQIDVAKTISMGMMGVELWGDGQWRLTKASKGTDSIQTERAIAWMSQVDDQGTSIASLILKTDEAILAHGEEDGHDWLRTARIAQERLDMERTTADAPATHRNGPRL